MYFTERQAPFLPWKSPLSLFPNVNGTFFFLKHPTYIHKNGHVKPDRKRGRLRHMTDL